MKFSAIFIPGLLAFSSVVACTGPSGDEETASTEGEIIRFPVAAFRNATPIAYGQTLANIPFKASQQFRAVKFTAAAGDQIFGTVDAGPQKSIVYVAAKDGNNYVNVKAGGQDGSSPNVVRYNIDRAGEYFLVFRTVPRADGTFSSVSLKKADGRSGTCADAGAIPTLQALASAVTSGSEPRTTSGDVSAVIERRECLYATGCSAASEREAVALPYVTYEAKNNGGWSVAAAILRSPEQPGATLDAAGNLGGVVSPRRNSSVKIPLRGSLGPNCGSLDESFVKVPVNASSYTEYRLVGMPVTPTNWSSIPHPAAASLSKLPVIDTLSDEEVLSWFPRGQASMPIAPITLRRGVAAGVERNCHPLTSCSAEIPASRLNACARLQQDTRGLELQIRGLVVDGPDSYALVTNDLARNNGKIVITDGVGAYGGGSIRLGDSQIQVTYDAVVQPQNGDVTYETSNTTCTFNVVWPAH